MYDLHSKSNDVHADVRHLDLTRGGAGGASRKIRSRRRGVRRGAPGAPAGSGAACASATSSLLLQREPPAPPRSAACSSCVARVSARAQGLGRRPAAPAREDAARGDVPPRPRAVSGWAGTPRRCSARAFFLALPEGLPCVVVWWGGQFLPLFWPQRVWIPRCTLSQGRRFRN